MGVVPYLRAVCVCAVVTTVSSWICVAAFTCVAYMCVHNHAQPHYWFTLENSTAAAS